MRQASPVDEAAWAAAAGPAGAYFRPGAVAVQVPGAVLITKMIIMITTTTTTIIIIIQ